MISAVQVRKTYRRQDRAPGTWIQREEELLLKVSRIPLNKEAREHGFALAEMAERKPFEDSDLLPERDFRPVVPLDGHVAVDHRIVVQRHHTRGI